MKPIKVERVLCESLDSHGELNWDSHAEVLKGARSLVTQGYALRYPSRDSLVFKATPRFFAETDIDPTSSDTMELVTVSPNRDIHTRDWREKPDEKCSSGPAPEAAAYVAQSMKGSAQLSPDKSFRVLGQLVNEFGDDFVCDQACDNFQEGGIACPDGSCAQQHRYDGDTCRDVCRIFIDTFLRGS